VFGAESSDEHHEWDLSISALLSQRELGTCLEESANNQERPSADFVEEENGDDTSDERERLKDDIVGESHVAQSDQRVKAARQ
jgi:hypothetical protein